MSAPTSPGDGTHLARPARLAAYYLASFAALGVFLPYWPRWLDARGVHGIALGAVAAIVPAVAIVAPMIVGAITDALRLRGAILRVACAASFMAFTGIALAGAGPLEHGVGGLGVVFLVGATAVFALARSPIVLVADVLTLERAQASGYGAIRRFGSLGFLLAAAGASLWAPLAHRYAIPALIAAASGAALLASFGLPARATPLPRPARAGIFAFVRSPGVAWFLVASALLHAAHASYDLTFSLHLRDLGMPDTWVGPTWALGVGAEIVLFSYAAGLARRIGHEGMLVIAAVGGMARWATLALVASPMLALALQPLHAVSFGCLWLGATGIVSKRAPPDQLASAQGTFSACSAAGHALGMLTWGPLHASHGGSFVFGAAAIVAGCAIVPAWLARRAR